MCCLLVHWKLVSHFYVRINFSEKEFNLKVSCKTIRKWWFCNPSKTYKSLIEKSFGPMSFNEKIMGGNKIENLPITLETKLRLMSQFSIKVYVGNTPQNHCLMMMRHCQNYLFLAAPERYFCSRLCFCSWQICTWYDSYNACIYLFSIQHQQNQQIVSVLHIVTTNWYI